MLGRLGDAERRDHRGSRVPVAIPSVEWRAVADVDPLDGPDRSRTITRAGGLLARTAIRPTYLPALTLGGGTTARTRSYKQDWPRYL
jgi:hypothetical protein